MTLVTKGGCIMAKQRLDAETKVLFKKMKEIVDKEVQHYKSDLDIDKEVIEKSRMNEFLFGLFMIVGLGLCHWIKCVL